MVDIAEVKVYCNPNNCGQGTEPRDTNMGVKDMNMKEAVLRLAGLS